MALIKTDSKHYEDIANSIRAGLNNEDTLKPNEMAEKINDVSALKDKKPYLDTRLNLCMVQFFKPVWVTPTKKNECNPLSLLDVMDTSKVKFWAAAFQNNKEAKNLTLDTSNLYSAGDMFNGCTNLETVELTNGKILAGYKVFNACQKLVSIICDLDYSSTEKVYTNDFYNCYALVNVSFVKESIIQSISFSYSNLLSLASLKSILLGLKNYAGTDNEFTYTITLHEDSWTLLDNDGATSPNGNSWRDYVTDIGWNA